MVKAISILGSTGSIGRQTAQAAGRLGIPVLALAARRDVDRLEEQARQFRPKYISVMDSAAAKEHRARLSDTDIEIGEGEESLVAAATVEGADCVVTGISGSVGLRPTLAAIHQKRRIALANKETLVCAGEIVMAEAARCGAEILPVDSEHSAIFQSMRDAIRASSGAFFSPAPAGRSAAGHSSRRATSRPNAPCAIRTGAWARRLVSTASR